MRVGGGRGRKEGWGMRVGRDGNPYRNYNLVTRVQQGCNKVVIQGCNNHETWL